MLGLRKSPYAALEKKIGYKFKKRALIDAALTHRSFRFENSDIHADNQRLEFLGDAVLGLATADYVYRVFKEKEEGGLTAFRSQVTSGLALSRIAGDLGLGEFLKVGRGEAQSGGRGRASNLADALESLLGAVFLDGGMKAVQRMFKKIFVPPLEALDGDVWAGNPKGKLQEYAQRKWKASPRYHVLGKEGPAHAAVFSVEVVVAHHARGVGTGTNKQNAEIAAATDALRQINAR